MSKVEEFLAGLNKTAAEVTHTTSEDETMLSKLANQNETIEASTTLGLASEYIQKLAEESGDELMTECAQGLGIASMNLMVGLNKIAANNAAGAIVDMVETQDGLSKIASVLEAVATEAGNDEFTKIADSVVTVNNTLFDELTELAEKDPSVAKYLADYHSGATAE